MGHNCPSKHIKQIPLKTFDVQCFAKFGKHLRKSKCVLPALKTLPDEDRLSDFPREDVPAWALARLMWLRKRILLCVRAEHALTSRTVGNGVL